MIDKPLIGLDEGYIEYDQEAVGKRLKEIARRQAIADFTKHLLSEEYRRSLRDAIERRSQTCSIKEERERLTALSLFDLAYPDEINQT